MSSAQPPSGGDRPAEGEETVPETAAPATPKPPASGRPTTTRRPPAAKKPEDAESPSPRKRSTVKKTPISPTGEAPEILDAVLGKPAPAADTSASPVEPLEPAAPVASAETVETAVLSPAVTGGTSVAAEAVHEGGAAATASTSAPEHTAAPEVTPSPATIAAPDATPAGGAPRQGRSVNELADRLDDSRFFSSLFDVTFTSYVTRKLAGPVYVVGLVLIGLGIVVGFVNSLGIAIATNSPGGAFVFLLGVLVTLVAAILSVLLLRVTIEVFCAIIEIAQNTRRRRPPRD